MPFDGDNFIFELAIYSLSILRWLMAQRTTHRLISSEKQRIEVDFG